MVGNRGNALSGEGESVDGVFCLRALDLPLLDRERISRSAIAGPRCQVKVPTGRNTVDADFLKSKRLALLASLGRPRGPKKIRAAPASDHGSLAIRLHQHR